MARSAISAVPSTQRCVACGYPIIGFDRCPECGAGDQSRRRRLCGTLIEGWRRSHRRRVVFWSLVPVVMASGAGFIAQHPGTGIAALLACSLAAFLPWCSVWLVERISPSRPAALRRAIWSQVAWILHLPWLVAPVMAGLGLLAAIVEGDHFGLSSYWLLGLAFWVLWSMICLVWVVVRNARIRARLGVQDGRDGWIALVFLANLIGSALLGFSAGLLAGFGAAELVLGPMPNF